MFLLNKFRRVLGALCLFVAVLAGALPAAAQGVPSVLEEVKLVTEDAQWTAFILRFSPPEPTIFGGQPESAQPRSADAGDDSGAAGG